jgi:ADP-heptose:LPS heptosyltransferase
MQSNSTPRTAPRDRLLVLELWGLGDVALSIPFLREASRHADVTLVAKPHAQPLLARFCPAVELVPLTAPWTAFRGKYRLLAWPWRDLERTIRRLRSHEFHSGVSARPDPRDHVLLRLAGVRRRHGFARAGSGLLLNEKLKAAANTHRADHWGNIARSLGWTVPPPAANVPVGRHVVLHTTAANWVREWPRDRFDQLAAALRADGWRVTVLDANLSDLESVMDLLASADRFIGNDSGPGHLASLLGVPTFTIFGPQLSSRFSPVHPRSAWVDGRHCRFKPCSDYCRYTEPHCIRQLQVADVEPKVKAWLDSLRADKPR